MKTIYKRIIGLLMVMPGIGLFYLAYVNKLFSVEQVVIFIVGALISSIIIMLFFYGAWLLIMGPEDWNN